jgi:PAS domain S-box-containing protein
VILPFVFQSTLSNYGPFCGAGFIRKFIKDMANLVISTSPSASPSPVSISESPATKHGKVKILLVDYRAEMRLAFETVLSQLDVNIVSCKSGKEALQELSREEFALVLLDVNMPKMDGFETAALIRQQPSCVHLPIIFIHTLSDTESHIARGYSLGAVDYILTPVAPEILRSKVSVFIALYKKNQQIKEQAAKLIDLKSREHAVQLAEAAERLEIQTRRNRFFNQATDMFSLTGFDGSLKQFNPAWTRILGYKEDELQMKRLLDFVHPDDQKLTREAFDKINRGEANVSFENRFRTKTQAYRWLSWTVSADPDEKLAYMFARDVTERNEAEEKIRQLNEELDKRIKKLSEINQELDTFCYTVSHDLRAPLRAIDGFTKILRDSKEVQETPEIKECSDRIIRSAAHMDKLIQELLAYSRITRAEMMLEDVSIDRVIEQSISHNQKMIQDRKARINVQSPLGIVRGHEIMLLSVFSNLIQNAVKFVVPGIEPEVKIWSEVDKNHVRIYFEDNGIGIPPEYHTDIFKIFTRLPNASGSYEGTGIGLSIAKKAVERMSGRIGLVKKQNSGSRFWVELSVTHKN